MVFLKGKGNNFKSWSSGIFAWSCCVFWEVMTERFDTMQRLGRWYLIDTGAVYGNKRKHLVLSAALRNVIKKKQCVK